MKAQLTLATFLALTMLGTASAGLIIEEHFLIDAANYTADATITGTSPDGTTGYNASDAWSTPAVAAHVDFRARSAGLSYVDTNGDSLTVAGGHLDTYRSTGVHDVKIITRTTTDATTRAAVGDEVWFSVLVNIDDADFTTGGAGDNRSAFTWDHQTSGGDRDFGILFEDSNNLQVRAGQNGDIDTGLTLEAGTNLVVVRLTDKDAYVDGTGAAGNDSLELWLNPTLGTAPTGVADYRREGGNMLVQGSHGDYGFDRFRPFFRLSDDSVLWDEFRLGDTFADVTPFVSPPNNVPEPASIAIWSFLGLCLAGYGYRRRRNG